MTCFNNRCDLFIALIAFLGLASTAHAQSGSIAGMVVDATTGETLIGANVIIEGTSIGSTTDLDGQFTIKNIEPGFHDLVFSYIGYQAKTVRNVEVARNERTRIDLALSPEAVGMDEVVIEARALENTEAALLKQRQRAAGISDAISAQAMSTYGSGDAAQAMSRVTGTSVVDGKYVYVRGLGDRYSQAQLNSSELPSADPDRNAAQLDLIPANLLDNIVATKTFTPDQPGSFSGGSININTKTYPESLTLSISNSIAYNSAISMSETFWSGPESSTDWMGFDSGLRKIPDILHADDVDIPRASQARRDAELADRLDAYSKAFGGEMIPTSGPAGINQSYGLSFGNQFTFLGRPVGIVANATYGREFEGYDGGQTAQFEATDPLADSLNTNFRFRDSRGARVASWGLLTSVSYRPHAHHEVGVNVMRSQDGEQLGRYQTGIYPKNTRPPVQFETYVLQYTERSMGSYQLRGESFLKTLGGLRTNWNVGIIRTTQDEPDLRFFFDQFVDVDLTGDGVSDTTVYDINLGSSNATPPTRIYRSLFEDNVDADLDVELPFHVGFRSPARLKMGGSYLHKDRTFRERKFNYRHNSLDFSDFGGDVNAFFAAENLGIVEDVDGRFTFGNTIEDGTRAANNYGATQEVLAGYAMLDASILPRLKLIAGARYETTDIRIVSHDTTKASGHISEADLLPSLSLVYTVRATMNLRASATRTLARPTFREIAPFTSFSFAGGPELSGNPDIERTLVSNLDARWEWFMGIGDVLAVSGFYKYFRDPIERVFISNNNQVSFVNVPKATVSGLEFELRKGMGWVAEPLKNLTAQANLALIRSHVEIPEREKEFAEGFDVGRTRPFQGQSPYVLNIGLSYDNFESGTSASVSFNRFGERLSSVSLGGAPNLFEQPRNDLYVSIGQDVFSLFHVNLSINNVLGDEFVESQRYKGVEFVTHRYEIGRTVKVSFSYDL